MNEASGYRRVGRLTHDNFFRGSSAKRNIQRMPSLGSKRPNQHSADNLYNPGMPTSKQRQTNHTAKKPPQIQSKTDVHDSAISSARTIVKNKTGMSFRPSHGSAEKLPPTDGLPRHYLQLSKRSLASALLSHDHLKEIYVDSRHP
jgi:hypothetical protein